MLGSRGGLGDRVSADAELTIPLTPRYGTRSGGRPWHVVARGADLVATALVVLAVLLLSGALVAELAGYRAVVIRSGSMRPTLPVASVIVSQSVHPLVARPGDIVSFQDPALGGRLVTHRVVSEERHGARVAFVTKGDANRDGEHWSVATTGTIGLERMVVPIPQAGRWLLGVTSPLARVLEVLTVVGLVAYLALGYVWRRSGPEFGESKG
ncbi:MAG: signal peptidase I [Candidatus Dormiibacterota bacterium]